jgi:hypothetical protein
MRINLTSVLVDDQDKAVHFYTHVLGFQKRPRSRSASIAGSPWSPCEAQRSQRVATARLVTHDLGRNST